MSSGPDTYVRENAGIVRNDGQNGGLNGARNGESRAVSPDEPQGNPIDFARCLVDEDAARILMERLRWNGDTVCPHCSTEGRARRLNTKSTRPGLWRCGECRRQFTVTVGTALAATHIPLHLWVYSIHMLCSSRRGLSASEIARELDVSYNAARAMLERLERALSSESETGDLPNGNERPRWYRGRTSLRPKTPTEVCSFLLGPPGPPDSAEDGAAAAARSG